MYYILNYVFVNILVLSYTVDVTPQTAPPLGFHIFNTQYCTKSKDKVRMLSKTML